MFEVQDLRFVILVIVSRCGMVWFSQDVLLIEMIFENNLFIMKRVLVEEVEEEIRRIKFLGQIEDVLLFIMQVYVVVK